MKKADVISEAQIEEALASNLNLLARYLSVNCTLKLIDRQMPLADGKRRLDLLLSCGPRFILAELKAAPYADKHLAQTVQYRGDLETLQKGGAFPVGDIDGYLLVTKATKAQKDKAKRHGVCVVVINPLDIMRDYLEAMADLSAFLQIKPKDYGAYSVRRMLLPLFELSQGKNTLESVAAKLQMNKSTIYHILTGAVDFGMVRKNKNNWFLTDFGDAFVSAGTQEKAAGLSAQQIDMVRAFVSKRPFYSPTVFGVYSIVECAFLLARNGYPINLRDLQKNFRMVSGKSHEWKEHVMPRRARAFVRFALELELLGRIGDKIVITPSGFRFILIAQLHKGIEIVEGMGILNGKKQEEQNG